MRTPYPPPNPHKQCDKNGTLSPYLYLCSHLYSQGEDGPEIRGGSVDALIVHAAAAAKSGELPPYRITSLPMFSFNFVLSTYM